MRPYIDRSYLTVKTKHSFIETIVFVFIEIILTDLYNPLTSRYLSFVFIITGCGAVVNNTLKSPRYPSSYPNNMDCVYRVHIPHGMAMRINFSSFHLESG